MKIYNKEKTQLLVNPDLKTGYLKEDLLKKIIPQQSEIKEQSHYNIIKEYPNGGKEVEKVIDVEFRPFIPEHEEFENIYVYIPYSNEELLNHEKEELRGWRERFWKIIDCAVWYDTLDSNQKAEVKLFRLQLLDITKTLVKPEIPKCILDRIK